MDASAQAIAAYGHAQKGATTDRGIEYQVFSKITASLLAAERQGKAGFNDLVHALHDNRRLWDAITVDIIDDNNELSPNLRAQLLSLAAFVRQHAGKVLRRQAGVQPIVDVNQAVMNGLRGITPQPTAVPMGKP
jgi:flagellar biosynthesis activator protein FlaF